MNRIERKLKHLNEKIAAKKSVRGERNAGTKEKRWKLDAAKYQAVLTPADASE